MPARFYEQEVKAGLKDKRKLSAFLDGLVATHLKKVKKTGLNYIFCTEEFLLDMNQQYLNHNTHTDIITFNLSDSAAELTGDIYISVNRVRENAAKFETTYTDELHRVIFHGALHLCGYKDKKEAEQQQMRKMENKCLKDYQAELQQK